jgi:hypothetical protein
LQPKTRPALALPPLLPVVALMPRQLMRVVLALVLVLLLALALALVLVLVQVLVLVLVLAPVLLVPPHCSYAVGLCSPSPSLTPLSCWRH